MGDERPANFILGSTRSKNAGIFAGLGLTDATGLGQTSSLMTGLAAFSAKDTRRQERRIRNANPKAEAPPMPPKQQKITVTEDMRPGMRNRQLRGRYGTLKTNQSTGQGLGLLQSGRTITGG
jgi:hypothetical protein